MSRAGTGKDPEVGESGLGWRVSGSSVCLQHRTQRPQERVARLLAGALMPGRGDGPLSSKQQGNVTAL